LIIQNGHDGGQRNHTGREQLDSQKGIDETCLSSFELADHNHIQGIGPDLVDQFLKRKSSQMLEGNHPLYAGKDFFLEDGIPLNL
jgi:hypothetical protein